MPLTNGDAKASDRASGWMASIAAAAVESVGTARLETLEIMTDVEQVSMLFASLDDVRHGRITNMSEAFGDL